MKIIRTAALAAAKFAFAGEAVAVEWNVSLWGKRRAFTEHVEKLAELVSAKTREMLSTRSTGGGGTLLEMELLSTLDSLRRALHGRKPLL